MSNRYYRMRLISATAVALAGGLFTASVAAADSVIRWMHVEQVPANITVWNQIARDFEAKHPGVKVEMQFLENQAFKAKLPTLLQSKDAPSIFYTWGGGVLKAQSETGTLRPINAAIDANGGNGASRSMPPPSMA